MYIRQLFYLQIGMLYTQTGKSLIIIFFVVVSYFQWICIEDFLLRIFNQLNKYSLNCSFLWHLKYLPIDLSQILSMQMRCVHRFRSEFSSLNLDSLRSTVVDVVHTISFPRVESKMVIYLWE